MISENVRKSVRWVEEYVRAQQDYFIVGALIPYYVYPYSYSTVLSVGRKKNMPVVNFTNTKIMKVSKVQNLRNWRNFMPAKLGT